ncbi:MAG: hypothetical protein ACPGXL_00150 [Chitinophagales bacterium]
MNWISKLKSTSFFIRLLHWEYWPLPVLYTPVVLYYVFLSLKARSFFFFSAANPAIEMGGLLGESKMGILNIIPQKYLPKTVFVTKHMDVPEMLRQMKTANINFPVIAKPDVGERGFLVVLAKDEAELTAYKKSNIDFIIQEYIDYPNEVGVMYYRLPNQQKGVVNSFTVKKYLSVTGDVNSTLLQLIEQYDRAKLQMEQLTELLAHRLDEIPAEGAVVELLPFGTHSRGAKFLNGNHIIDQALTDTFDKISHELTGVYFGRYDIKCKSIEDLKQGKHFSILEINGVKAEPTHIYDPGFSFFTALNTLFKQWNTIYQISKINHQNGVTYPSFSEGIQATRDYFRYKKENG